MGSSSYILLYWRPPARIRDANYEAKFFPPLQGTPRGIVNIKTKYNGTGWRKANCYRQIQVLWCCFLFFVLGAVTIRLGFINYFFCLTFSFHHFHMTRCGQVSISVWFFSCKRSKGPGFATCKRSKCMLRRE